MGKNLGDRFKCPATGFHRAVIFAGFGSHRDNKTQVQQAQKEGLSMATIGFNYDFNIRRTPVRLICPEFAIFTLKQYTLGYTSYSLDFILKGHTLYYNYIIFFPFLTLMYMY
jgi:hypothetical protein